MRKVTELGQPATLNVIVNLRAGADDKDAVCAQIEQRFAAAGRKVSLEVAHNPAELKRLTRRAVALRPKIIMAAGGDGTINMVSSALRDSDVTLGLIPLGTFNFFARNLNIPLDLDAAVDNVLTGVIKKVNIGVVNDRIFLNNASFGLYTEIIEDRERRKRVLGRSRWVALLSALLTALRPHPSRRIKLTADGVMHEFITPMVFFANNALQMKGLDLDPSGCIETGRLCILIMRPLRRLKLFALAIRSLLGRARGIDDLEIQCAREVLIERRRRIMRVAIDGEIKFMRTPLRIATREAALTVIVPPSKSSSRQ